MTQESVSGKMGSSVLGYVVHPCREVYLFDSRVPRKKDDPELCLDLMTTRTGYFIKHTSYKFQIRPSDRFSTGRRGEDHRLGFCYVMLLGELIIYSLLHAARWRWPEA